MNWTKYTIEDIKKIPQQLTEEIKEDKNYILSLNNDHLNFTSLIHKGEDFSERLHEYSATLWCYLNLHTDESFREAARLAELEITKIIREYAYDQEVFSVFQRYVKNIFPKEKKSGKLTDEEVKIVDDTIRGYKKMGMDLSKKDKKVLLQKKNKMSKIGSLFEKDATLSYSKGLWFTKEDLKGVPENIFQSLQHDKDKEKYFVKNIPTELSYVFKYCVNEQVRKKLMEMSAYGVGDKNTKRLAEILKLRSEISKMLKYKIFRDLVVLEEMLYKSKLVDSFLDETRRKLTPIAEKEKTRDFKAYQNWQSNNNIHKKNFDKKLMTWNWAFASNLSKEKELGVKEEDYKPYFELENTLKVLFNIWEKNYAS
jgi:Zn-dependent oligopeptidase